MNCGYVLGDTLRSYVATVTIPYTYLLTTQFVARPIYIGHTPNVAVGTADWEQLNAH